MRSAFGEPPCSGVRASARYGAASASFAARGCKAAPIIRIAPRSSPLERRLALLGEGAHALDEVVAANQLVLDLGLEVQLVLEVAVEHPVQRALRAGVGARRPAGQLARQLEALLREALGLDDAVDQAPV